MKMKNEKIKQLESTILNSDSMNLHIDPLLSLNTKSFVLNMILSSIFHTFVFFLSLSACHFISFYILFNTTFASSYTFFILYANSITFSIFSFCLISIPILNSLLQFAINRNTLVVKYILLLIANSANANYSG